MSRSGKEDGEIGEEKGGIDEDQKRQDEHVKLDVEGEAKYLRSDGPSDQEKGERLFSQPPVTEGAQVISAACQSNPSAGREGKEKEAMLQLAANNNGMLHHNKNDEEEHRNQQHQSQQRYFFLKEQGGEGSLRDAFLTLTVVLLNLIWSLGLTYWNFQLNNFDVAVTSLAIIILSGSINSVVFFTTTASPSCTARSKLWGCSKLAWLLCAVPCNVPVVLAAAYFISSVRNKDSGRSAEEDKKSLHSASVKTKENFQIDEDSNGTTSRGNAAATSPTDWKAAAGCYFLIESLTLCFPMCVLHGCVLLENGDLIPSWVGCFTLLALLHYSFSITVSRFQYDTLVKRDRFGEGKEMYLRMCYLWSAKIIWLVTFSVLIVTTRLLWPDWKIEAIVVSVAVLTAMHEIPLWICLLPQCGRLASKVTELFFLIPQFTSLVSLIYWVNTDTTVYDTNIGSIVLGLYFWAEAIMLCGWLADGNADKDLDLLPLYPHFFGDLISFFFVRQENPNDETTDVLIP